MAEIKVEPKRGGLGWLWAIIILALIAAAVWYFMHTNQTAPAAPADSTRTSLIDRKLFDQRATDGSPTLTTHAEGASNG
jgi:hypothetical protein